MNDNFINIKVDREERPDLDRQYMMYVKPQPVQGGWPSTFSSPTLTPIFGGTYFAPREDTLGGRPSFKSILETVAKRWKDDWKTLWTGKFSGATEKKAADIVPTGSDHGGNVIRIKSIQRLSLQLQTAFDPQYAGFGSTNKFPMPGTLRMLLRYWSLWKDLIRRSSSNVRGIEAKFWRRQGMKPRCIAMWKETIETGWKWHVRLVEWCLVHLNVWPGRYSWSRGWWFHRYTVDRAWSLPSLWKMLYDQAQLIKIYSEAYLEFDRDPEFRSRRHRNRRVCQGSADELGKRGMWFIPPRTLIRPSPGRMKKAPLQFGPMKKSTNFSNQPLGPSKTLKRSSIITRSCHGVICSI